jgi:hypothetical protein
MKSLKHIGRVKSSDAKAIIIFRTIPGDSGNCLVTLVKDLTDAQHDDIMQLVETVQAQEAFEFGEILSIRHFQAGKLMLPALIEEGKILKIGTSDVVVTPTTDNRESVLLSDLNVIIAEQKNCTVDELCNYVSGAPSTEAKTVARVRDLGEPSVAEPQALTETKTSSNDVLSDKDLAKNFRSQADALYKEAARLRKEAETLDPTVKKTKKAEEEEASA